MCGRLTLKTIPQSSADFLTGLTFPTIEPRYNIAPTQPVVCVLGVVGGDASQRANASQEAIDWEVNTPSVRTLSWGLIPAWEKHPPQARRYFNARSETAAQKPAFGDAFKKRRCLIVADGFYEWKSEGKAKRPFYITHTENRTLWLAGLWEPGDADRGSGDTCTILTTQANQFMRPLHHRMPVILPEQDLATWLGKDVDDASVLQPLLVPCEEEGLEMRPVSTYVNNAKHQGPDCLSPPRDQQRSLF